MTLLPPLLLLSLLLQGPYFLGSDISLVDITFAPMLERAAASLCYYKVTSSIFCTSVDLVLCRVAQCVHAVNRVAGLQAGAASSSG